MARYDIYGVGNALVDIEYQIDIDKLLALECDKGIMTLIDSARHHELLKKLEGHDGHMTGGGSAANTIVAAAQLGSNNFYACRVADDTSGRFFIEDLGALGIRSSLSLDTLETGVTGKCIVLVTPDADRTMNTYLGATREFSIRDLDIDAIRDSRWLYIEGYLVPETNARAAAVKAREVADAAGVNTALTLSDPNMVQYFADGLHEIAGTHLDLCFANEGEARLLFEANSLEECVLGMKSLARRFAITMGPDGALLFDGQDEYTIPAPRVEAIDTNGAGDMYAGCFLYGLTHGMSFRESGSFATGMASYLATQTGPRLTREVMQRKLGEFEAA